MAAGRDSKGRIRKGWKLTKGGRVVKKGGARKRSAPKRRRRVASNPAPKRRRRRRITSTKGRTTVAKKRRRRRSPARRRRYYRRNPRQPAIIKTLTDGAVGAFQVLAGKAAARTLGNLVPLPGAQDAGSPMGVASQAIVAVLVSIFGKQLFGAKVAGMLTVGALTAPVESIIIGANIPVLSPALSAYPSIRHISPDQLEAYVPALLPGELDDVTLDGW